MPLYEYVGITATGTKMGTIDANSKSLAKKLLLKNGIKATKIHRYSSYSEKAFWKFLSLIGILLQQNIPLVEALKIGARQPQKKHAMIFEKILLSLEDGNQFHDSIENIFPAIDKNKLMLLRIGVERAGLKKVIASLLEQKRLEDDFSLNVQKALSYPIFVLLFAFIALIVVFDTVLPEFESLIDSSNASTLQNIIMKASGKGYSSFVRMLWYFISVILGLWLVSFSDKIKVRFFVFCNILPIIKNYLSAKSSREFLSSMSLSLSLKSDLMEAVRIASMSVLNPVHSRSLFEIREKLKSGYSFSSALSETRLFTDIDIATMELAEQSNNLPATITEICRQAERARLHRLSLISQIIAPLSILVLGLIIFLVAYVVITPMVAIQNSIG